MNFYQDKNPPQKSLPNNLRVSDFSFGIPYMSPNKGQSSNDSTPKNSCFYTTDKKNGHYMLNHNLNSSNDSDLPESKIWNCVTYATKGLYEKPPKEPCYSPDFNRVVNIGGKFHGHQSIDSEEISDLNNPLINGCGSNSIEMDITSIAKRIKTNFRKQLDENGETQLANSDAFPNKISEKEKNFFDPA